MSKYLQVGERYFKTREQAINSNTYFEIERGGVRVNQRFHSREYAIGQIKQWRADNRTFSVHEVQNTEVTRKSAKGNVFTETIHGSLVRVPRIISVRHLNPTYVIVTNDTKLDMESRMWDYFTHFKTRAEAEQERAKRQNEIETLAAFTEADIKVHTITDADMMEVEAIRTLADLLERDEDKITALATEFNTAYKELCALSKQAEASVAADIVNLESQIAALREKATREFGVKEAQQKCEAAEKAHREAIRYYEFEDQAREKMLEDHNHDCWPNSGCRVAGECTYEEELTDDEIEEYLCENADEFELEDGPDEDEPEDEPAEATTA